VTAEAQAERLARPWAEDRPAASLPERAQARSPRQLERVWVAVLLVAVAVVQGWNSGGFPSLSDDEGTYLSQAWAVDHGLGLSPYTYWYDHPPAGWLQLALLQWVPEHLASGSSVAAARGLMVLVAVVNAGLLYVLARRVRLHPVAASAAVVLFAMTPLALQFQHKIFLDNLAVGWLLAAFVLALSPRRHLGAYALVGGLAGMSILTKETMLLALPGLVVALAWVIPRQTRSWCWVAVVSGFVSVVVVYPLYAVLQGELLPGAGHVSMWDAVRYQLTDRPASGSVLDQASSAHELVTWWLSLDPVVPMLGLVASVVALASPRLRGPALSGLVLAAAGLRPSGYLPAMYVIGLLPFFALAIAGVAQGLVGRIANRVSADGHPARRASMALAAGGAIAVVALVAPGWGNGVGRAFTSQVNSGYAEAVDWLAHQPRTGPGPVVVSDNTVWLDLVERGVAERERVLWFYKVDLDPAVAATLPGGWRDIGYVVSTPEVRANSSVLPTVAAAIAHSDVVASFGSDGDRVDILRVSPEEAP
jgi:4-amino-4-deoxy-L-arabinose transferase-like glycosyltransferase